MRNRHFDYRQECMVGSSEYVRSVVFFRWLWLVLPVWRSDWADIWDPRVPGYDNLMRAKRICKWLNRKTVKK